MNTSSTPKGSVRMMDLPQVHDTRGDLTFVEGATICPLISRGSIICTTCRLILNVAVMRIGIQSRWYSLSQEVSDEY